MTQYCAETVAERLGRIGEPAQSIYNLLRHESLCASQIGTRTDIDMAAILQALETLKVEGLVEQRPDRRTGLWFRDAEQPWSICA